MKTSGDLFLMNYLNLLFFILGIIFLNYHLFFISVACYSYSVLVYMTTCFYLHSTKISFILILLFCLVKFYDSDKAYLATVNLHKTETLKKILALHTY